MKKITKKQLSSVVKVNRFFMDLFLSVDESNFVHTDFARYIFSESTRILLVANLSFRFNFNTIYLDIINLYNYYLATCVRFDYKPFNF